MFLYTTYITVDMKCITVPLSLQSCNLFLKTTSELKERYLLALKAAYIVLSINFSIHNKTIYFIFGNNHGANGRI